jgi:2-octaprenyl-6-methoxyphenol hydroxylase
VQHRYDCIIAGAGFVGITLALALDRLGISVAIADRRKPEASKPVDLDVRGLALSPSSRHIFDRLGVWARLAPHSYPIDRIHVSDRGHLGFAKLNARDAGVDALGYVCRADRLRYSLDEHLHTTRECDALWGAVIDRIDFRGHDVSVTVDVDGSPMELVAPLLIGADGPGSKVREAIDVPLNSRDYWQSAVVANVSVAQSAPHTAFERFTQEGPVALVPLSDTRYVAVRCCARDEAGDLAAATDDDYLADLQDRFGYRLGRLFEPGPRRCHDLALQNAQTIVGSRTALAGAAANSVHPNAAQGLNLGLRDAAALARIVGAARDAGADIGSEDTLRQYAACRVDDHRNVVGFTDGLAGLFAARAWPIVVGRDLALTMLDVWPSAKRRLIVRAMGVFDYA